MPLLPTLGRTIGTGIKATRLLVRGSVRGGAWATRRVGSARAKGAANEIGMIRLFDLHAVSCAGDTLVALGLAGTIFNVPLGEARGKVALYLLITMVPFALLAPVVGPLLDHFRHGRRWALAITMLGRFFLAYVIADHLTDWGLYPAAFGVLALSRAYGVARSAAVPRLLPEGVGLSQVGARASVYGTFAGAVVAPIGLLGSKLGAQWPLWFSMVLFAIGGVISLRLPPRADSDPPEAMPVPWRAMLRLGRGTDRPLSGKLVIATLIGSASLRLLYGFLLLFFTFVIAAHGLSTKVFGHDLGPKGAVGLVGGALAAGTFLSTALGARLRIRRPLALQATGLTVTAVSAVLATLFWTLPMVALTALLTATFSGVAKLAIDSSLQERVPERLRASAFAHSETILMIAWVIGGGLGIVPIPGRLGIALAAALAVLAAARATLVAMRLHNERLSGRSDLTAEPTPPLPDSPAPDSPEQSALPERSSSAERSSSSGRSGDAVLPDAPIVVPDSPAALFENDGDEPTDPWPDAPAVPTSPPAPPRSAPLPPPPSGRRTSPPPPPPNRRAASPAAGPPAPRAPESPRATDKTMVESPKPTKKRWFGRDKAAPTPQPTPRSESAPQAEAIPDDQPTTATPAPGYQAPPGFHVYRPSSASPSTSPEPSSDEDH